MAKSSKTVAQEEQKKYNSMESDPKYIEMKNRTETIQRSIDSLVHSCMCRKAKNCRRADCLKLKKIREHMKICKTRLTSECRICKHFTIVCCYHSSVCPAGGCSIPFCMEVRKHLGKMKPKLIVEEMVKSTGLI